MSKLIYHLCFAAILFSILVGCDKKKEEIKTWDYDKTPIAVITFSSNVPISGNPASGSIVAGGTISMMTTLDTRNTDIQKAEFVLSDDNSIIETYTQTDWQGGYYSNNPFTIREVVTERSYKTNNVMKGKTLTFKCIVTTINGKITTKTFAPIKVI